MPRPIRAPPLDCDGVTGMERGRLRSHSLRLAATQAALNDQAARQRRVRLVAGAESDGDCDCAGSKPIVELEKQIDELKQLADERQLNVVEEIAPSSGSSSSCARRSTVLAAPARAGGAQQQATAHRGLPPALLHRFHRAVHDRAFQDAAIMAGGHARRDDGDRPPARPRHEENLKRNFGMPPRGYRKALRLMKLAEYVPVITFIDTPGAWAGLGPRRGRAGDRAQPVRDEPPRDADHRHDHRRGCQARVALASPTGSTCSRNAVYSVITEGCAAILEDAEPGDARARRDGAAHHRARSVRAPRDRRDHPGAGRRRTRGPRDDAAAVQQTLLKQLDELRRLKPTGSSAGVAKFMRMGQFLE